MRHHEVQELGRSEILSGYHLRVGEVARDTRVPDGHVLQEQRLDETEVGERTTTACSIDARRRNTTLTPQGPPRSTPEVVAVRGCLKPHVRVKRTVNMRTKRSVGTDESFEINEN